jgi:hypothetical protein
MAEIYRGANRMDAPGRLALERLERKDKSDANRTDERESALL